MIKNKVYQMDVFEFLEKLENDSIDLAIIDPPYNLMQGDWDCFKTKEAFLEFTYKYLDEIVRVLKTNGTVYIFNTPYNCAHILTYLASKQMCYRNWITWYKKDGFSACKKKYCNNQESILYFTKSEKGYVFNADEIRIPYLASNRIKAARKTGILKNGKRWFPNEAGKLCPDVWEFSSVRHKNKVNGKTVKQSHPTPKPEEMIERMIKASSNEGDLVLDLFCGTGTTSYCAIKLNRNFIACDNNKEYCEYTRKRCNL